MTARRRGWATGRALARGRHGGLLLLALAAGGCDQCGGVVGGCTAAPRLSVSGQIVDWGAAGTLRRGVRIEAYRVAGAQIDALPVTTTDDTGWWAVEAPARDTGAVALDVRVTPPEGGGYVARFVRVRVTTTRGDGNVLGRWTSHAYIAAIGEVFDAESGARVGGAQVRFARRSGTQVEPTPDTRSPMTTNDVGQFTLFLRPADADPVYGDFTVERPGAAPVTVPNVRVDPQYEWLPVRVSGSLMFYLPPPAPR